MSRPSPRRVEDTSGLLAAAAHAPDAQIFLRCELPAVLERPGWVLGGGFAVVRRRHTGGIGLCLLGDADDLAMLLTALRTGSDRGELSGLGTVTVPRAHARILLPLLGPTGPGGDWDWMWTDRDPAPVPDPGTVVLDDDADAAELRALNTRDSPTAESEPGTGRTEHWVGVRGRDGSIVAAGALHRTAGDVPHIAGVVVAREHRGRGLGAAVTAELTRAALRRGSRLRPPLCTLGMYADNATARRLYHRLGYRTAQQFASVTVPAL